MSTAASTQSWRGVVLSWHVLGVHSRRPALQLELSQKRPRSCRTPCRPVRLPCCMLTGGTSRCVGGWSVDCCSGRRQNALLNAALQHQRPLVECVVFVRTDLAKLWYPSSALPGS